ncbi:MAG: flagellar basal body P-ring formation chaperone FlgA [Pseudomonadota bacterium]|nr:flagellar basal body P-ring formation chaperone FlgA [Pseudomonadota bacterium]
MLSIALLSSLARATPRALAWLLAGALALVFLLLGCSTAAHAAEVEPALSAPALDASLLDNVRSIALGGTTATGARRVEVVLGQLDPRLRLAPCQRIEPYLPVGVRLWGKARIGLRCKEGATAWNVYLPITVKVYGLAVVMPAGAAAGTVVTAADLAEAEVDLAEEFSPAIVDPKLAEGRLLAQTIRPGQTLRQSELKARQYFAAGETVRVIASGNGFALESEGQALNNGIEGQPARIRTESGRIVTGLPSGDRRVEVGL